MAFVSRDWKDAPQADTPLDADGQEDQETRLAAYAESVAAGGIELGYAQITADVTQTGAGSQDVTGLSVTVTVGTRPIVVEFGASGIASSSASGITTVTINEGATIKAKTGAVLSTVRVPATRRVRLAPSAGAHTYKIVLVQTTTGNGTISAGSDDPAYIQVLEV